MVSSFSSQLPYVTVTTTDQPAEVHCETCDDDYCEVCFSAQHRKGNRKRHLAKSLADGEKMPSKPAINGVVNGKSNGHDVRFFASMFLGGLF